MDRPATFAERLKTLLEVKQITKAELSRMTGIGKSSLTRYAKGDWEGKQDAVYAIANATDVDEAWLMGYDVPMERPEWHRQYREQMREDYESGRSGARDEMFRVYGEDHGVSSTRRCENKTAILFYKAVDHRIAPELTDIIHAVDELDFREIDNIRMIVRAYLKAADPIKEIVNTALKPYMVDEFEDVNDIQEFQMAARKSDRPHTTTGPDTDVQI